MCKEHPVSKKCHVLSIAHKMRKILENYFRQFPEFPDGKGITETKSCFVMFESDMT